MCAVLDILYLNNTSFLLPIFFMDRYRMQIQYWNQSLAGVFSLVDD